MLLFGCVGNRAKTCILTMYGNILKHCSFYTALCRKDSVSHECHHILLMCVLLRIVWTSSILHLLWYDSASYDTFTFLFQKWSVSTSVNLHAHVFVFHGGKDVRRGLLNFNTVETLG
jgi:hypothetical protein